MFNLAAITKIVNIKCYNCKSRKMATKQKFISELCKIEDSTKKKKCFSLELSPQRANPISFEILQELSPVFCSVTWHQKLEEGDKVADHPAIVLAKKLSLEGFTVLLHVASRGLTRTQAMEVLSIAKAIGIRNILALRGDNPEACSNCDFPYAIDFVRFIRRYFLNYFCIGVAGYPEAHPQNNNQQLDLIHLKEKAAYADFILTQLCFDVEKIRSFAGVCQENGINLPIFPGVLLTESQQQFEVMVRLCQGVAPLRNHLNDNGNVKELVLELLDKQQGNLKWPHIFALNNLKLVQKVALSWRS